MSIKIVDAPMGFGKTSAMINYMRRAADTERFVFVTPYLEEVERIKMACPENHFKVPSDHTDGDPAAKPVSKLVDFKKFVQNRENVVTTHALFKHFDDETVNLIQENHYTLVMDEVMDIVSQYPITEHDCKLLGEKFVDIEPDGSWKWRESERNYTGKFDEEKELCRRHALWRYADHIAMQMFPKQIFQVFDDIYILTYLFKAQKQRCYFDFMRLNYQYLWVTGDKPYNYQLSDRPVDYKMSWVKDAIHICDKAKFNQIGNKETSFSAAWFDKNAKTAGKQLGNHTRQYFETYLNVRTNAAMWTCYKSKATGKQRISVRNFTTSFVPCNIRATNDYRDRTALAYLVNRYLSPVEKQFFLANEIRWYEI